jgi:hypothetical protein
METLFLVSLVAPTVIWTQHLSCAALQLWKRRAVASNAGKPACAALIIRGAPAHLLHEDSRMPKDAEPNPG